MKDKRNLNRPISLLDKWQWILAGILLIISVLRLFNNYAFVLIGKTDQFDWFKNLIFIAPKYLLWYLFSFLIFKIYSKTNGGHLFSSWQRHFVLSLIVALIHSLLDRTCICILIKMLEPETVNGPFLGFWTRNLKFIFPETIQGLITYWSIFLLISAMGFYDRYRSQSFRSIELEAKLNESKLSMLKNQLQPHFLFNTLNTISMIVRQKQNKKAVSMIERLSTLLRTSLESNQKQLVKFKDEVAFLNQYLEIERVRFSDRLKVEYNIDPKSQDFLVPHGLLQPLAENAIKYGLNDSLQQIRIVLESNLDTEYLKLKIFNSGEQLSPNFSEGIGIGNSKVRLENIYRGKAEFSIGNSELEKGVEVIIKIPLSYE